MPLVHRRPNPDRDIMAQLPNLIRVTGAARTDFGVGSNSTQPQPLRCHDTLYLMSCSDVLSTMLTGT